MSEPTLYRKLPVCDGCGNTQSACIGFIRNGWHKCCPDCKHEVPVERCEHGNIDPHLGPYIGKDGTVTVGNYPCLGADLGGDEDE